MNIDTGATYTMHAAQARYTALMADPSLGTPEEYKMALTAWWLIEREREDRSGAHYRAEIERLRTERASAIETGIMLQKMLGERQAEIDRLRAELAAAQAAIARVREVITDHDDCTCQVREHGCYRMWDEMREVFLAAPDGGAK